MSMMGELYRVPPARLGELLADPAQVQDELYPDNFPANVGKNGESVEKTWNAIDFTLERLVEEGTISDVFPLTGGSETGYEAHYGPVWYRTPDEVAEIASELARISRAKFRKAFAPKLMAECNVYPNIWDREKEEDLFAYVWEHFQNMVKFYRLAARKGDAVLLHIA